MRGLDVGNKRHVHVEDVLRPDFENELPDGLQKWQTFNVSGCAADLCDHDVVFALV